MNESLKRVFFLRLRKNIQNIINNIIGSWAPDMISVWET